MLLRRGQVEGFGGVYTEECDGLVVYTGQVHNFGELSEVRLSVRSRTRRL